MGGGDLNLKKSWHPHTMKNMEKVWKAEQVKKSEEKRMHELQKEIQDERNREELKSIGQTSGVLASQSDNRKLEWMYKGTSDLLNRDDYLLGKSIDKSFEQLSNEEKQSKDQLVGIKSKINHVEHECIPFSIRAYRNLESTEQVDLQLKVLEDPLMLIKQKEMATRRKLLENPVKLKELHRILQNERSLRKESSKKLSKKKKNKHKSSKIYKKKRQNRLSSSSSDSSDEDLDTKLANKLRGSPSGFDLGSLLDAKYETISKELDKATKSMKKKKNHKRKSFSNNSDDSQPRNKKSTTENYIRNDRKNNDRICNRSLSASPRRYKRQPRHRSRSVSHMKNFNRNLSPRSHGNDRNRTRSRSKSPRKQRSKRRSTSINSSQRKGQRYRSRSATPRKIFAARNVYSISRSNEPTRPKKLTEAEKEKRFKEMMENAAWRDEDRTRHVKNYREEYQKEEDNQRSTEFDKDFIKKEIQKAIKSQTSVESRIKSNINNIQRSSAAMNANFARK